MKKISFIVLSSLLLCSLFSCGKKEHKITFIGSGVSFSMREDKVFSNVDYSSKILANPGHFINQSLIKVSIGGNDVVSSNETWTYSNDNFYLKGTIITNDVVVTANSKMMKYNISFHYDDTLIQPLDSLPSKVDGSFNLNVRFHIKKNNYAFSSIKVLISGKESHVANLKYLENNDYLFSIDKQYMTGDIDVKLNADINAITVNADEINILNYDNFVIKYYSPIPIKNVTSTSSDFSCDHNRYDHTIEVKSTSNKTCRDGTVIITNDDDKTKIIKVNVNHPSNCDEALDSLSLAVFQNYSAFDITFNYDNKEDYNKFIEHSEIGFHTQNALYPIAYNVGINKTNSFVLDNSEVIEHIVDKGNFSPSHDEYLGTIANANYVIRKKKFTPRSLNSKLPVENYNKTLLVKDSDQLFWALEHKYIPTFDNTNPLSLQAQQVYEKAYESCLKEISDEMNELEKITHLYDYLLNISHYDYWVIEQPEIRPLYWQRFYSYFADGVFLNNGIAVCDGLSKAYVILCGIENLPVIRSFGYAMVKGKTVGHAWNYAQIEGCWYLLCPTNGNASINSVEIYGKNIACPSYYFFLEKASVFADYGYPYSDRTFPSINRETNAYSNNIYTTSPFSFGTNNESNFYIDSYEKLVDIFYTCRNLGLENQNYSISLSISNVQSASNWIRKALQKTGLKYHGDVSYVTLSKGTRNDLILLFH